MEILLDTNFVLACAKQKIDFDSLAEDLLDEPVEWVVPQEVLNELGNIKDSPHQKGADKEAAKFSFELLQTINPRIIELGGKSPNIDIRIVNYILDKPIILATLDKGLKERVKNPILTIRGKKGLEIIRA
jgi:rRNA-processing protein FCF1